MVLRAKERKEMFNKNSKYYPEFIKEMEALKRRIEESMPEGNWENPCSKYHTKMFQSLILSWYATCTKEQMQALDAELNRLLTEIKLVKREENNGNGIYD